LSFTHRKEWVRWTTGAKKTETRASRVARTVCTRVSEHADPGRDDHRLVGLGDDATRHAPASDGAGQREAVPARQYT
jgi:hypothetical protein